MARVFVTIFEELVPISGGGTPRIRNIIDVLVEKGHEVTVASSLNVNPKDALKILKCHKIVPLKKISRLDKNKIAKYLFFHPYNISKIVYEMKRIKPEIIIAHNSVAGLASLLAKKVTNCFSVMDMTDLLFEYLHSYSKTSFLAYFFYKYGRRLENKVIRETNKIVTISNAMKRVLIQKGAIPKNIEVIYDGVRPDLIKPCKQEAKIMRQKFAKGADKIIIHHGVIDPQDRPEIIVDAAISVLKEHPQSMFWLVGDGLAIPAIREKVKQQQLEENFFFSGWVPFEEIPYFISASDIGLVILPNTLSARVRVTLKGFEYWACEKPIIVPKLPALTEIVRDGENGLFYKPDNPKDLAEKICILLEDNQLSKKMGMAGRELVKREYNWKKLASNFVSICEGML